MTKTEINYWTRSDADLAASWREIAAENDASGYSCDDDLIERINFVEDAILQRIGAPDDADPDEPEWQNKIRVFGESN